MLSDLTYKEYMMPSDIELSYPVQKYLTDTVGGEIVTMINDIIVTLTKLTVLNVNNMYPDRLDYQPSEEIENLITDFIDSSEPYTTNELRDGLFNIIKSYLNDYFRNYLGIIINLDENHIHYKIHLLNALLCYVGEDDGSDVITVDYENEDAYDIFLTILSKHSLIGQYTWSDIIEDIDYTLIKHLVECKRFANPEEVITEDKFLNHIEYLTKHKEYQDINVYKHIIGIEELLYNKEKFIDILKDIYKYCNEHSEYSEYIMYAAITYFTGDVIGSLASVDDTKILNNTTMKENVVRLATEFRSLTNDNTRVS